MDPTCISESLLFSQCGQLGVYCKHSGEEGSSGDGEDEGLGRMRKQSLQELVAEWMQGVKRREESGPTVQVFAPGSWSRESGKGAGPGIRDSVRASGLEGNPCRPL